MILSRWHSPQPCPKPNPLPNPVPTLTLFSCMHADLVVHRALVASLEEQAAEADLESSEMIGELMSTEHQLQKRLGVTRNLHLTSADQRQ